MPAFHWVTCQPGFEPALKRDIGRLQPDWRFAFSRPGFITFRTEADASPALLPSPFARAWGRSIGKTTEAEAAAYVQEEARSRTLTRLHVWPRIEDERQTEEREAAAAALESSIRAGGTFLPESHARADERVLDVIHVDPGNVFVGEHLAARAWQRWPGGKPTLALPEDAPSRAWLKLEEAAAIWEIPFRAGDSAVEVGCAPGGVVHALLKRGLRVTGVDAAEMDPVVTSNARFRHVRASAAEAFDYLLPERVDWWLMDMNVGPEIALRELFRLVSRTGGPPIKGCLLTLKLNEASLQGRLARFAAEAKGELGLAKVELRQLHANRGELTLYGEVAR